MNERMLQIYEDSKLSPAERRAKKRKEAALKKKEAAIEKENLLKSLLEPYRFATDFFLEKQEIQAYNFLFRLTNRIFDLERNEKYDLVVKKGGKQVTEMVLLWKVKSTARPFFEAVKNTKGFGSFITWVHYYGEFEKKCTAELVVDEVSWVLRYGKDKAAVKKDSKRRAKEYWASNDAPKMAHSLSSKRLPNQRTLRSLLENQVKGYRKKIFLKKGGEAQRLEQLMNSEALRRDLVKKDEFLFSVTKASGDFKRRYKMVLREGPFKKGSGNRVARSFKKQPAAGLLKSK